MADAHFSIVKYKGYFEKFEVGAFEDDQNF